MNKIKLGKSDLEVSVLAIGSMYFGSKVDKENSFDLLDKYREQGGNFIDCANKYASWLPACKGGEAEGVVGEYIHSRGIKNEVVLSSKVGFPYGEIPRSLSKDVIISECERSLKRLKTDTIDLYFAHAFDKNTPLEESMEAFHQLKKQGKIRYAGASNFQAWQMERANNFANQNAWEGFVALQQKHTYMKPILGADFGTQMVLTPELVDWCANNDVTMMGYSPLQAGVYAKKGMSVPPQYLNEENRQRLEKLNKVAEELNVSANTLVLAWMFQSSPRIIPVVGSSNLKQLSENLLAAAIDLSPKHLALLNDNVYNNTVYS